MEMLWDLPQGWPGCWKGLLFTVTILSSSLQLASLAQLSIVSIPSHGTVGSNITLSVHGIPKEPQNYSWFRQMPKESNKIVSYAVRSGEQTQGLNHTGRESIFPNGSLFIINVTSNDNGAYIVQVTTEDSKPVSGQGHLQIHDSPMLSHIGLVASIVLGALAGGVVLGVLGYFLFKRTRGSARTIRRDSVRRRRNHPINQNHGGEDIVYENHQWHRGMTLTAQGEGLSSISSRGILEIPDQALDINKMDVYDEVMIWPTVQASEREGNPRR
ncbi:carcinoembryonic antigen-related cell adhesion molecule 3-like isoform X1 [Monodelphis domestica]|uniref:carcinoembryonic antigen-related cell adhesion molecule 3-like isoform X1 n=1 Tax=Monodelphis domestica TaxID=13616 RepID=UPI0024E267CA|nr:carcinoembryonic antigen-related cell adhesion molecule 3-like isoform X1 [Monodelphis domestica]